MILQEAIYHSTAFPHTNPLPVCAIRPEDVIVALEHTNGTTRFLSRDEMVVSIEPFEHKISVEVSANYDSWKGSAEIKVWRTTVDEQETDLVDGRRYHLENLERQLDRTQLGLQEISDATRRSLRVPTGEAVFELAAAVVRAGKTMVFDAAGLPTYQDLSPYTAGAVADGLMAATLLLALQEWEILGPDGIAEAGQDFLELDAYNYHNGLTYPNIGRNITAGDLYDLFNITTGLLTVSFGLNITPVADVPSADYVLKWDKPCRLDYSSSRYLGGMAVFDPDKYGAQVLIRNRTASNRNPNNGIVFGRIAFDVDFLNGYHERDYVVVQNPENITQDTIQPVDLKTKAIYKSPRDEDGYAMKNLLLTEKKLKLIVQGNRIFTAKPVGGSFNTYNLTRSDDLGLFCAISSAANSLIATSSDGVTFTQVATLTNFTGRGICWSHELGLFVAVGEYSSGNTVATSPDGTNWTRRTPSANLQWRDVCWSPKLGLFVAVAYNMGSGGVMTSPDGINWTSRTPASARSWFSVVWSPELEIFCAVSYEDTAGNRVMTSPDGINWTGHSEPSSHGWTGLTWSSELGLFVAVTENGENRVGISKDGIAWEVFPSANESGEWTCVKWCDNFFVMAMSNASARRVAVSPNGRVWKLVDTPSTAGYGTVHRGIAWSPSLGRIIVGGQSTAPGIRFDMGWEDL